MLIFRDVLIERFAKKQTDVEKAEGDVSEEDRSPSKSSKRTHFDAKNVGPRHPQLSGYASD